MKNKILCLVVLAVLAPSLCMAMGREPKEKKSSKADFGNVSTTSTKRVELYVTSWCGYCKKLERHFKEQGISYDRYDIEADPHAAEVFRSIGGTGVPVTRIGSDVVYGYDPDRIAELLWHLMPSGKYKIARSAGGVVVNPKGQILIVNQNNNSWSLPKGHLDQGETALEAAQREIYEESGVHKLEFIKELGSYERPKIGLHGGDDKTEIKHITLFLFKTTQTILRPVDPDNPEAKWVLPEEVSGYLTHELDKKYFLSLMPVLKRHLG